MALVFRRRAFNIESLTVGRTSEPGVSRMTIVLDSDQTSAERVTAYLYKLVNVLQVEDLGNVPAVARDLALVKVAVAGHDRAQLLRVVDETRAHIVDSGEQTMTLEITGEPPHVDSVIARLEPLGIVEMVRPARWRCGVATPRCRRRKYSPAERGSAGHFSDVTGERMATMFYDKDADIGLIRRRKVAVIGYGSQGRARAEPAGQRRGRGGGPAGVEQVGREGAHRRAQGADGGRGVEVGRRHHPDPGHASGQGLRRRHQTTPHRRQDADVRPRFNIRFNCIVPPADVDVTMVAPKAPGHRVARCSRKGGTPGLLAVHQDATGVGRATALAYARGIGCTRAGVIETTFSEETETDLFGEQAVLCGGTAALVKAGFETLVEAGYQPEVAYFECMHELKLIVDLMYRGGLSYMRYSISDTAEWGDYTAGPRLVTEQTKQTMKQLLTEIQSGEFAKRWIAENDAKLPVFMETRAREQKHQIEVVGAKLRGAGAVPRSRAADAAVHRVGAWR